MRISPAAVLASILFSLGFSDTTDATRLHHRLTVTDATDDVVPEARSEIHIIENANLKHIFKVNRLTGQVSECDYDPENGNLETCAVQGYDARPGKLGNYVLENADLATAVYRVDLKTGIKTICAISNGRVFCLAAHQGGVAEWE
jgi:hypothetical protein